MKNTAATFLEMKQKGEKISMLTCYDYSTAKLMEQAGVNGILVGDSLGNTMLGQQDTLSVTMEDMIHHGHAVAQACSNTMVVIDMPFMSYQASIYDAVTNAGRLMKEGRGNAVKLEGGAFSVVMECVPPKLAALISKKLVIPTIGIGAGAGCDGQILVYQDMLGMFTDYVPKFVRQFANVGQVMTQAFTDYMAAVQDGSFPEPVHTFAKSDCSDEYLAQLDAEL